MGQLSLFDVFGSEPNPVPRPPRPPKRNDQAKPEPKLEKQADSMQENELVAVDKQEEPVPVIASPIITGLHYEPPTNHAPVFEPLNPFAEASALQEAETEYRHTPAAPEFVHIELANLEPVHIDLMPIEAIPLEPKPEEAAFTEENQSIEIEPIGIIESEEPLTPQAVEPEQVALKPIDSNEETIKLAVPPSKKGAIKKEKETNLIPPIQNATTETTFTDLDLTSLTKQYYSISEVAKFFGVNASHLRYWEKEFPAQLGNVRKNGKGDRFYTPKNIAQLQLIFHLVRNKKMTLEGARKQLKQQKKSLKAEADAHQLLLQVRRFLVDLKKQLD